MTMLQIKPIFAALKRHKAGTLLIGLQIALTLAIVCNALFIIEQRVSNLSRSTGIDENNLLIVQSAWTNATGADIAPLVRADLQTLRQLPGVQDAAVSYGYPLKGGGWNSGVNIKPDAQHDIADSARFYADEHLLPVLGAKLIAGRNFRSDETRVTDSNALTSSAEVIVTKALADRLYPDGSVLGKPIYVGTGASPSTVIGVVDQMQGPFNGGGAADFSDGYVLLEPTLLTDKSNAYLIRTKPGQLAAVTRVVRDALFKANRMRIIEDGVGEDAGIRSFAEVRAQFYKSDRGLAWMMGVICVVLLGITAAGIVGLTSFWVGQRRKQIGVRRALGATQHDIIGYFLTENLLISMAGVLVGTVLALGLNLWLMKQFEMARIAPGYVMAGLIVLLLLGQGAALAPALRASRVPPVEATRSV
jgi:putative ABC transport system permease protein